MEDKIYTKPFWVNRDFNWYYDEKNQAFLTSQNDFNLPPLNNLQCCIVVNKKKNINDFVLIDNKQNVYASYSVNQQYEYETKIKMLKIKKYYDERKEIKNEF